MLNKKGVDAVVATVLIIMITVAAVAIIWMTIIPMIKTSLTDSTAEKVSLTIELDAGYTVYDSETGYALVQIKRGSDKANLEGVEIVFFNGVDSKSVTFSNVPSPSTSKVYAAYLINFGDIQKISVYPVFDGKIGSLSSQVTMIKAAEITQEKAEAITQEEVKDVVTGENLVKADGINFVGASAASGATVTLPAHSEGDLLLAYAFRDGSTSAPSLPSGWTNIYSNGWNSASYRLAYKIATNSSTPNPTFTSATEVVVNVYNGTNPASPVLPIQYNHFDYGATAGSTNTLTYKGVSSLIDPENDWVVAFGGHRSATNVEQAPTGMVNRASAGTEIASFDTDGIVSSFNLATVGVNAASGWITYVLELSAKSVTQSVGSGTLEDPYIVRDCLQLQDMRADISANYSLGKDIDCSDSKNWNGGQGFIPIGSSYSLPFTGNFDGKGYTISNLYINTASTSYRGLFGATSNSNISNVKLVGLDISGSYNIGGLVGYARSGNINNVQVSGKIRGYSSVGGLLGGMNNGYISNSVTNVELNSNQGYAYDFGGLVGYLDSSQISHCSSSGKINLQTVSENYEAGGLVGYLGYSSINSSSSSVNIVVATESSEGYAYIYNTGGLVGYAFISSDESVTNGILNSYATGNVTTEPTYYIYYTGGLIGSLDIYDSGNGIENCYATGNVIGKELVGGLIGYVYGSNTNITSSYSVGNVSGSSYVNGLVGLLYITTSSNVTNSYWYNTTANPSSCSSAGNTGCTAINTTTGISYFYNQSNAPMNVWSPSVWSWSGTSFPTLK